MSLSTKHSPTTSASVELSKGKIPSGTKYTYSATGWFVKSKHYFRVFITNDFTGAITENRLNGKH
jgi:hypothetical protein